MRGALEKPVRMSHRKGEMITASPCQCPCQSATTYLAVCLQLRVVMRQAAALCRGALSLEHHRLQDLETQDTGGT